MLTLLRLKCRINHLPKEIQQKIYIHCFRKFWREYIPLTAKVPSWYQSKIDLDQYYFNNIMKNVHFLHYHSNCLPDNKEWIMGCQCEYCIQYVDENPNISLFLTHLQYDSPTYFDSTVPKESVSQWNNKYKTDKNGALIYNFNPLYGSIFDKQI